MDPNRGDLEATGRQAGTAAAAAAGLALATIAMITEFLIYSGFAPRVKMRIFSQKFVVENYYPFLMSMVYHMYHFYFQSQPLQREDISSRKHKVRSKNRRRWKFAEDEFGSLDDK